MKEKIEDKLNNELKFLLDENEKNITILNEKNLFLNEIESSISNDVKIDLNKLSKEMQNVKILKEDYEELTIVKSLKAIIEKSNLDTFKELETIKKLIEETLNNNSIENKNNTSKILLISNSINKLISNKKNELEKWFVEIKFPVFEGNTINTILAQLGTNHNDKIKFFSDYFEIVFKVISHKDYDRDYNKEELFTDFFSKKVIFTFLQPFLKKKSDVSDLEKELLELFDLLISYTNRVLSNLYYFIYYCLSQTKEDNLNSQVDKTKENKLKVKSNSIQKFIIKNFIHQINLYIEKNFEEIIAYFSTKHELLLNLFKKFSDFNKTLKKDYDYDIYNYPLLSDVVIDINKKQQYIENLNELIKIQKSFASMFIKSHLKSKLSETIEKNEFTTLEIFELIKIIIKDNFKILLCFAKDANIFKTACENFHTNSFKEILGLFRSSYNEEFQIFSSKKSISRKKILFTLDLIIKFLLYTNSLYNNLRNNSKNFKIVEIYSNYANSFTLETNKMIENYTSIFSKELRANGFDGIINLFSYDNLTKLNEENIEAVFSQVRKLLNGLHQDFDIVKISIESENYFLKSFLLSFLGRIIEECERSLKKIPKNKYFNLLTDKANKIIDEMLSRFTINSDTMSGLKKPLEEMRRCFLSLNMNKI